MIPSTFHRIWFGPKPMPARYVEYGEQWLNLHPGWTLTTWTYENLPKLVNQEIFDGIGTRWPIRAGAAKPETVVQVQQADIAAYEIVFKFGGVYLNCDIEPVRNIGPLLNTKRGGFLTWEADKLWISNAVLASYPHHPFWTECIARIPARMERGKQINWQTGPALVTETWRDHHDLMTVYPQSYFNPVSWQGQKAVGPTYAIHHWGHKTPDEKLWPAGVE